jgi:hypothetical protein
MCITEYNEVKALADEWTEGSVSLLLSQPQPRNKINESSLHSHPVCGTALVDC